MPPNQIPDRERALPVSPHRRIDPAAAQWLIQSLTRMLATYAVIQGVGIILGGSARWEGNPALAAALSFPGAPASWGFVLGGCGLVTLTGTFVSARAARYGASGISAWSLFFALTLAQNVIDSPKASTTGPGTYAFLGFTAAFLAVAYRNATQKIAD